MADFDLRLLERSDSGDVAAGARLLLRRGRIGLSGIPCSRCEGAGAWCDDHGRRFDLCASGDCGPGDCWLCRGLGRQSFKSGLVLAEYVGDLRAREALRVSGWGPPPDEPDFERWATGISRWPKASARAALAVSLAALDSWTPSGSPWCRACEGQDPLCVGSCAGYRARQVVRATTAVRSFEKWIANWSAVPALVSRPYLLPGWAMFSSVVDDPKSLPALLFSAVCMTDLSEADVRLLILRDLAPWALAEFDPALERLERRGV